MEIKPVYLDTEKCNGCVNCMKRCPTEAIRVRNGKAAILYERCIGCGECVKVCPTHAKKEAYDSFAEIKRFKYKVAVPAPSIYGQFNNIVDTSVLLTAVKRLGFDDVVEAAAGAEYVSAATEEYLRHQKLKRPVISSACPAVVNLILMRYEHLVDHLSPMQQPEEVTANMARAKAEMETGLPSDEIGVFVIAPCAANVLALKNSVDAKIDGVLSFKELYFMLLAELPKITQPEPLALAGRLGVSWGSSSGEAMGLKNDNFLAADGMENVISVLNEVEHDRLTDIDFLELNACTSGCVGGTLNIESPFMARTRLRRLRSIMPDHPVAVTDYDAYKRREPYRSNNVFKLDDDLVTAMRKMLKVKEIVAKLPGINCGSCGAPNCMALAEDVVRGLQVGCKYREVSKSEDRRNHRKA